MDAKVYQPKAVKKWVAVCPMHGTVFVWQLTKPKSCKQLIPLSDRIERRCRQPLTQQVERA